MNVSSAFSRCLFYHSLCKLQHQLNTTLCHREISGSVMSAKKEVNGVNLHYETVGSGSHPLILLPGAAGSSRTDFQPQLEKLNREKFIIVAIDPRGYGRSRPPQRDFPLDFFHRDAKDAKDLMLALGHDTFSILGWSDGAVTGIILAAKYQDCVRKLVMWGGNSFGTEKDLEMYEVTRDIGNWSKRMRDPMIDVYGEAEFQQLWIDWIDGITRIISTNKTDICMKESKEISVPTFILHGDKDPMVPEEHPLFLHKHIKGSRLYRFPDGKHNIHLKYVDEFNKLIEDFLEEDKQ